MSACLSLAHMWMTEQGFSQHDPTKYCVHGIQSSCSQAEGEVPNIPRVADQTQLTHEDTVYKEHKSGVKGDPRSEREGQKLVVTETTGKRQQSDATYNMYAPPNRGNLKRSQHFFQTTFICLPNSIFTHFPWFPWTA